MSMKRLAALLMAAVLCITCMSCASAECTHERATCAELAKTDVNVDIKHAVSCPDCLENWYEDHVYEDTTERIGDTCSLCHHVCTHASTRVAQYVYDDGRIDATLHLLYCNNCGCAVKTEKHNYENSVCKDCDYVCIHNGAHEYERIDAHQHYDICYLCKTAIARDHYFRGTNECYLCDFVCDPHTFNKTKADGICTICGMTCKHSYENSVCKTCGYKCEHENKSEAKRS